MKILLAGSWTWLQNEKAFGDALTKLGHEVVPFAFREYFKGKLGVYQEALPLPGPALWRLNRALAQKAAFTRPDVILVWNGTHVLPRTLKKMKAAGACLVSYSNDDPFGPAVHGHTPWHHHFLWMWYLKCLHLFDVNFVNRPVNIREAASFGGKNVHVMKSYFIPEYHRPVPLSADDSARFSCDIVFAGHYEPDGREECLRVLVKAGVHVRLFGGVYWTEKVLGDLASYFGTPAPVRGDDYAKALCGAKICLSFLSKLNRDTYTRRCFEIPACGRVLLCERTEDLQKMFVEGEEAEFFSNKEELLEKARRLLGDPQYLARIAEAGRKRVWADGHDVVSRAGQFLKVVGEVRRP